MTRASKILPPSIPAWSIRRPTLEERLMESLDRRLTTVTAGAGFGKSTLLAAWSAQLGCSWYTIDESDRSLSSFAAGIVDALRERVPELPRDLSLAAARGRAGGTEEHTRAEAIAAHLSEALDPELTEDLALILDEVQELGHGTPAARLIEALCRHAPERLHVILASRSEPPFSIERLRGRGEVLPLDPSLLAFSEEEVARLLETSLGADAVEWAARLHAMTGGWPAAIRLAIEALRGADQGRANAIVEGLGHPGGLLFGYLAEEVFANEPPETRELLRRMAPFDRFSPGLCKELGLEESDRILMGLVRRGLFVQPLGGPERWFTVHALARDFVRESWPLSESEIRTLHGRAAVWFESQGHLNDAIRSLIIGSDATEAARLLSERGRELLAHGALEGVLRLAAILPSELRNETIEAIVGEAHHLRGEFVEALECFRRAAEGSEELPPRLANWMGQIYSNRGENDEALRIYARGGLDGSRPAEEARLLCSIAAAHLLRGDPDSCDAFLTRALEVAEASGDASPLAKVHAMLMTQATGRDPTACAAHYQLAVSAALRAHDIVVEQAIRTNRASQLIDEGFYEEALSELETALRLAELCGSPQGLILDNRGEARLGLGRLDEALRDLEASRAEYERLESNLACWPLAGEATVYRERGELARAQAVCEEALRVAERSGDAQGMVAARGNLAQLLAVEEPDRAARLADAAIEVGRSSFGLVPALLAAGWVALARGDRGSAADLADEAAREAGARRQRAGLAEALELRALAAPEPVREAGRLEEALAIWRELGNQLAEAKVELALARLSADPTARARGLAAEHRLQALGVRPRAAAGAAGLLAGLPREVPPPVEIRTLGGFHVLLDGKPVPLSAWQSKKARDLVKILLARRGRPVPREVLMDLLWPDEDPRPVAKRFAVALATARAVLDPQRRFASDRFIAGDDAALWIDMHHVPVDVERFLAEAEAGLALERRGAAEATGVLAAAEASYAGDFLEEDPYEDWAVPLRENARSTYIAVARALASAAAGRDPDAAVRYCLRVLERDPFDEEAHLALVETLVAVGRTGEARRAHRAYVARMQELEVDPAPFPARPPLP